MVSQPRACGYLVGRPDTGGLGDPFPRVDASVQPDGRPIRSPSAELHREGGFQPRALPGLGKATVPPVPTFSTYRGLFS